MRSEFETPEVIRVQLENALHREVVEPARITVSIDRLTALAIIGNLQLALRHPLNRGITASKVREFIALLTEKFPPTMQEVVAMGFDSAFDHLLDVPTER